LQIIDANTIFGPCPRTEADLSLDRLVQAMKSHDVAQAVTLSTVGIYHAYSDGNAETLAGCQDRSELIPAATMDPRGFFPGMKHVQTLLGQGFRLFRFFPDQQGWPLDHSAFADILDELEATSAPVMVNAGRTGDASALVAPGALRFLAEQVGAQRIIFGSDCPRSSMAGALRYVRESGLSDDDLSGVLGNNIRRLLGG
jgi:hypothetical protein